MKFQKGHPSWKGKKRPPRSEEWQRKLNKSLKGKAGKYIRTDGVILKNKLGNLGRKHSEKSRQNMGLSRIGENNPNWKDGITLLSHRIRTCYEYRQWRSDVFTRDKFICQDCGYTKGRILEADHTKTMAQILKDNAIETFDQAIQCSELWDINNGRTLCRPCHWIKTKKDLKTWLHKQK